MDFLNKTFKNRVTGDTFKIIDVYQNIAITDKKEKINTAILSNEKLFSPMSNQTNFMKSNPKEDIDPNQFFDSQKTYNTFAEKIKNFPLDKFNDPESSTPNNPNNPYSNLGLNTNESAIIMSDPEDEIEELKRKYGATTIDDSVRRQNEIFSKILEEPSLEQNAQIERSPITEVVNKQEVSFTSDNITPVKESVIQRIEVEDPLITMFKNVKRNVDFNIDLKIEGKIPRLDFIEMMEDSYEISIIEYLAKEFTQSILRDPKIIQDKITQEIKNLLSNSQKNVLPKQISKTENEISKSVSKRKTTSRKKEPEKNITPQND